MSATALMLIMSENYYNCQVLCFYLPQTLTHRLMRGFGVYCGKWLTVIIFRRISCIKTKTSFKQLSNQQLELKLAALPAVMGYFLFTVLQKRILWLMFLHIYKPLMFELTTVRDDRTMKITIESCLHKNMHCMKINKKHIILDYSILCEKSQ